MARGSKIGPAVILTALVLAVGVIGSWFILGDRQKAHAIQIQKNDKQIQAYKDECDKKIEAAKDECDKKIDEMREQGIEHTKMMTEQNVKQTRAWTEVQTDIKWIKEAIRNGN